MAWLNHQIDNSKSTSSKALKTQNPGLLCRMHRFVAGMQVAVVVYVEYPATDLVIVTVMDVKKD